MAIGSKWSWQRFILAGIALHLDKSLLLFNTCNFYSFIDSHFPLKISSIVRLSFCVVIIFSMFFEIVVAKRRKV
ncbi:MAG: hypothetical protein DYG83_13525 [Candidatus Brocadia sp. AMX2]|nr:MAG: hypothetical protein EDM70_09755 [Candidatus Brocadia sp. AMX2]MBC6932267.1 hypothetical protein [Candidatus Brocadia sp.]MCE7867812.1 hypothetical protein [Candidatus Brocadia sp. AMX2]MCQ3917362.1 hypothetical protein [Candidatus Brocadia sp.]RIJ90399.1 MAG: hypothetical protein DB853_11885 [Candidatus Brocadia sp.]